MHASLYPYIHLLIALFFVVIVEIPSFYSWEPLDAEVLINTLESKRISITMKATLLISIPPVLFSYIFP